MARDGTKLALFIDGVNTHAAARTLGFDKGPRPVFVTLLLANVCFGSVQKRIFADFPTKSAPLPKADVP
jgi:hypothetical protein